MRARLAIINLIIEISVAIADIPFSVLTSADFNVTT